MKDMPDQTEEIHQQDMKILHDMGFTLNCGKHSYQLAICSPYKGTVLYKELEEQLGAEYMEEHNKLDGGRDTLMTELNKHSGTKILSNREKQVLSLIDKGFTSKEISFTLSISINTVSRHRQEILANLQVKNSIEACRIAKDLKLI